MKTISLESASDPQPHRAGLSGCVGVDLAVCLNPHEDAVDEYHNVDHRGENVAVHESAHWIRGQRSIVGAHVVVDLLERSGGPRQMISGDHKGTLQKYTKHKMTPGHSLPSLSLSGEPSLLHATQTQAVKIPKSATKGSAIVACVCVDQECLLGQGEARQGEPQSQNKKLPVCMGPSSTPLG